MFFSLSLLCLLISVVQSLNVSDVVIFSSQSGQSPQNGIRRCGLVTDIYRGVNGDPVASVQMFLVDKFLEHFQGKDLSSEVLSQLLEANYECFFEMVTANASYFAVLPEGESQVKGIRDFEAIAALAKFGHIIYQANPFNCYSTTSSLEGFLVFETLKHEYGVSLFRQ